MTVFTKACYISCPKEFFFLFCWPRQKWRVNGSTLLPATYLCLTVSHALVGCIYLECVMLDTWMLVRRFCLRHTHAGSDAKRIRKRQKQPPNSPRCRNRGRHSNGVIQNLWQKRAQKKRERERAASWLAELCHIRSVVCQFVLMFTVLLRCGYRVIGHRPPAAMTRRCVNCCFGVGSG